MAIRALAMAAATMAVPRSVGAGAGAASIRHKRPSRQNRTYRTEVIIIGQAGSTEPEVVC